LLPDDIKNGLIVSCQPVPDGPTDSAEFVVGFARAAVAAGAKALRIESVAYVRAVRVAVTVPIIGIVKRHLGESPVRITPFIEDAEALAAAGADVIAFDATERIRPASVEALVQAIKASGKLTMADCSSLDDARRALAAGVDFVGTTLSGYIGGPEPVNPDIALIKAMRGLTAYVIAEGRIRTTEQAAAAASAGAHAVVVGSAITRTEHATEWFREAISRAYRQTSAPETVLAIDIGGTKTMAALVKGQDIVEELTIQTLRAGGPDQWLASIAASVATWQGRYSRIAIAVTGFIDDGRWSALNPATLGIPADYPLVHKAAQAFGVPVFAVNDAQAAAWGEFKFGAGSGGDMVFLTISTGIGGGVVVNGQLLGGLAGHFGLIRGPSAGKTPFEDQTSGHWIAAQAAEVVVTSPPPRFLAVLTSVRVGGGNRLTVCVTRGWPMRRHQADLRSEAHCHWRWHRPGAGLSRSGSQASRRHP
jgi:N-acetylmannosamine-6-phosphate 2-epimerase/N-acetylmannosamine kinase